MRPRRRWQFQNALFYVLLLASLGLLAWLGQRHHWVQDLSADARGSLSQASRSLLERLHGPVRMTVYLGPGGGGREAVRTLVGRYQRHKRDLELSFVNPETDPGLIRQLNIRSTGEMIIAYGGREERLQQLNEQTLSNALLRLLRGGDRWLGFLQGHGERDPAGAANHDLARFAERLEARGIRPRAISLVQLPRLPDNLHALVIAGPQTDLLPGEVASLEQYLEAGGNLALLLDPDSSPSLQPLLERLGVRLLPGIVVDATTRRFNIDNPTFALVDDFPTPAVTQGLAATGLLPQAVALAADDGAWRAVPVMRTGPSSWTEISPIDGRIGLDAPGEVAGPLTLALALARERGDGGQQRVLVTGDGDFIANAYLGNGGNLELGLALAEWLAGDGDRLQIVRAPARDRNPRIAESALIGIALTALVGVPGLLLAGGLRVWRRRHR